MAETITKPQTPSIAVAGNISNGFELLNNQIWVFDSHKAEVHSFLDVSQMHTRHFL